MIRLPDFAAIDAYIEAEISATHIPGLALAIVQGDQIAHLIILGIIGRTHIERPQCRLMLVQRA